MVDISPQLGEAELQGPVWGNGQCSEPRGIGARPRRGKKGCTTAGNRSTFEGMCTWLGDLGGRVNDEKKLYGCSAWGKLVLWALYSHREKGWGDGSASKEVDKQTRETEFDPLGPH